MSEVYVEEVCKQYRETQALDNITCTFEDGQLTVLVGPSGCGKTTLLRTIAGLIEPSSGAIYIGKQRVDALPPWERNIAMVFQSYALYPHMTVFKNIAFPLEATRTPKDEIKRRVLETARILQIENLLDRKPRELSGGQMQRVALGRAIVRKPEVFLMDEPLSNLDAKLRVVMRAELKHLQTQLGVTTVYVTHDQAEAMTLADKLIVMNAGRIQQVGRPEELYRHPRNIFVAGFIGSPPMNFIEVQFDPAARVLTGPGLQYPLGPRWLDHLKGRSAGELILGVRPESITVAVAPSAGMVPASVYVMEQLGREILLDVKIGSQTIRAFVPADMRLRPGQDVWLQFHEDAIYLFDPESEVSLSWKE